VKSDEIWSVDTLLFTRDLSWFGWVLVGDVRLRPIMVVFAYIIGLIGA
tara:strand:- start:1017 stop:1160 length:144 start_codon:yes stop_codon:yes gene_type:complete